MYRALSLQRIAPYPKVWKVSLLHHWKNCHLPKLWQCHGFDIHTDRPHISPPSACYGCPKWVMSLLPVSSLLYVILSIIKCGHGEVISSHTLLAMSLPWRHNERDGVSNHQPHDCLLNRLFRRRSKKTSKLRVTGLCDGNSPVTGEFPAQRTSNAENVSIWWRHHDNLSILGLKLVCVNKICFRTSATTLLINWHDYLGPFFHQLNSYFLDIQATLSRSDPGVRQGAKTSPDAFSFIHLHTEVGTKWLTLCRRRFQVHFIKHAWWRHQTEIFSALLAICVGNSPVPVNSPHKGQWRGALMFSLICTWINGWVNNREAGDLGRHSANYDVIVMAYRGTVIKPTMFEKGGEGNLMIFFPADCYLKWPCSERLAFCSEFKV